ncbi:MAG TPA: class I SAM-dependent methyltransferase [Bryobacteraceae bacterium]|nr:class I SAM-dependent methyltransferase [Bryobacteraceae bacterium]
MAAREISKQLQQMRRDWDRRAKENARHYVVTGQSEWSDEEFFRSGEVAMAEDILNDLTNICQGKDPRQMDVLEIGCGAGRVTRAFANFFGSVCAVDISREMVRQARRAVAGFPNARVLRNNGKDLSVVRGSWWQRLSTPRAPQFDFAFSSMVFQHIPSRAIIESYLCDVHRLLRPGALFKFQVQGSLSVEARPGDSWVGVAISESEARQMAERSGFELRYQAGAGEQYYWLWCFKKSAG